jgi:hypothetical protein
MGLHINNNIVENAEIIKSASWKPAILAQKKG